MAWHLSQIAEANLFNVWVGDIITYNYIIGGFHTWGYPQIIHFNGISRYKPSILGTPIYGNLQLDSRNTVVLAMLACNACNFEIFTNFLAKEQLHILMEACYFQARHNRWLLLQQVAFEMHWVLHVFSLFVTVLTEHVLFSQALHTATEMPWRLAWMTWLQLMAKGKETEFSSSFGYWDFEKLLRSIGASPNFGFIPPLPARAMKMALSCKLAIDQAKCKKLVCGGWESWLLGPKNHG